MKDDLKLVAEDKVHLHYIRQPYRITMAKWNYTVIQKRILTRIIACLQKEITLISKGHSIGQLELFSVNEDTVKISFPLNELVKNNNNYTHVKAALQGLRKVDVQIVLPTIKGKPGKKPQEETILTGLIERATIKKHSRTVDIVMHKATAIELIEVQHGLTNFAEDIMFLTDNSYTQKFYEILSHWKDKAVFSISPEDFRKKFYLENKYKDIHDLIKRVIKPSEIELKEMVTSDIYFEFSTTKPRREITKFNFVIIHRRKEEELEQQRKKLLDQNAHLLRTHFKCQDEHILQLYYLLSDITKVYLVQEKIGQLYDHIQEPSNMRKIKSLAHWTIASLQNQFPKE